MLWEFNDLLCKYISLILKNERNKWFSHPKQFPDGIVNSGSLWHQLGPIFRQKLWLVDYSVLCPYHHQQRSGSQQATTRLKLLIHGHSNLFLWLFSKCDQIWTRENPARLSRKAKNNEVYSIRQTPKAFVCFGFRSTTYFIKQSLLPLKYYSPTVTHDKIFVYDFCVF